MQRLAFTQPCVKHVSPGEMHAFGPGAVADLPEWLAEECADQGLGAILADEVAGPVVTERPEWAGPIVPAPAPEPEE
jgi:hypothetical protein